MSQRPFQTVSALRIYLKRGDNKKAGSWWARMFERPLSQHLLQAALKAEVTHASINLGHMGFAKGAKGIAMDMGEIPMSTLPVCLELLGPKRLLEQFVRDQARHLTETTLMMVDGIHLSPQHLGIVDEAVQNRPHSVEYIGDGDLSIPVDHVIAESTQQLDA